MNKKNIYKIGLSLLIAMIFILPGASVMGSSEGDEASERSMGTEMFKTDGPIAQQQCEVQPQGIFDPDFGPIVGNIPTGTYDLWAQLLNTGCGPAEVKVFLEIYEKGLGEEFVMYETSFEDNFDIYNNWVQIDADCGLVGGQYDSWTWTDARANCGEHSMKSSMYDVYKGNQEDYLEYRGTCLNITSQYAVNVSFDIYVDGSGLDSSGYFYDYAAPGWRNAYMYVPFDYLDFEVYNDAYDMWMNPSNWMIDWWGVPWFPSNVGDELVFPPHEFGFTDAGDFIPGSYIFFDTLNLPIYSMPQGPMPPYREFQGYEYEAQDLGNGWWHVWYEIPTATFNYWGGDSDCFKFRFSWHSDPEVQYEGAYVDCVKVVSIEDIETKVWQGHTQGPVILQEGVNYVDLPLDWEAINKFTCNDKTTLYDFKLWLEVLDVDHYTNYELPFTWLPIVVNVGNYYDAEVTSVVATDSITGDPIGAIVEEGADITIDATVHLEGTVPTTNVPVTFTAQKKEWKTIWSNDFEGNLMGWTRQSYNDYDLDGVYDGSLWHITDFDAYTGSSSLGCFDEDTKYYLPNMYYDLCSYDYPFSVENLLECKMDLAAKWITEDMGPYTNAQNMTLDRWCYVMLDQVTNSWLSCRWPAIIGMNTFGFQPDWVSPTEPRNVYHSFDVLNAYNFWHDVRGSFTNDDLTQSYQIDSLGFIFFISDPGGCFNPLAQNHGIFWSGVYIDDVVVSGLEVGDEVYKQTVIIPEMEPCESYDVEFEWENIPYCHYLLTVDANAEGGCDNFDFEPWTQQVLVTSTKEVLHNPETIDYTAFGLGEWVISSSDTDNYIASQSGEVYDADQDEWMWLCLDNMTCGNDPDKLGCIDISRQITAGTPVLLDFDVWWEVEGMPYDDFCIYFAFEPKCPAENITDWYLYEWVGLTYGLYYPSRSSDFPSADADGFVKYSDIAGAPIDITALMPPGSTCFQVAFRFVSDGGWNERGVKFTNIYIDNLYYDEFPVMTFIDFVDPCNNLDNWCQGQVTTGSYWFEDPLNDGTWMNFYDADGDFAKDPLESTIPEMDDALLWTTTVEDCVKAWLAFETDYQLEKAGADPFYWDHGYVEISEAGLNNWAVKCDFTGTTGGVYVPQIIDISEYAGKDIQIRFRLVTDADAPVACDHWYIRGATITGKQDHLYPITTATMTGTLKESGWYTTAVKIVITAVDQGIAGMGEIHYKVDGVETVVAGNTATVNIAGNGDHTFEYWGCDAIGNCEPHHVLPAFKIDSGAKPTVSISAPTPGIYFNGKKLLSSSNTIIIGSFTAEATAADADSGIYRVSFYLDDQLIGDDTSAPFSMLICKKHMGAGTLKVVAEDFAQNTAEASMSLKYFKFF